MTQQGSRRQDKPRSKDSGRMDVESEWGTGQKQRNPARDNRKAQIEDLVVRLGGKDHPMVKQLDQKADEYANEKVSTVQPKALKPGLMDGRRREDMRRNSRKQYYKRDILLKLLKEACQQPQLENSDQMSSLSAVPGAHSWQQPTNANELSAPYAEYHSGVIRSSYAADSGSISGRPSSFMQSGYTSIQPHQENFHGQQTPSYETPLQAGQRAREQSPGNLALLHADRRRQGLPAPLRKRNRKGSPQEPIDFSTRPFRLSLSN